jgi:hypothetical protein
VDLPHIINGRVKGVGVDIKLSNVTKSQTGRREANQNAADDERGYDDRAKGGTTSIEDEI